MTTHDTLYNAAEDAIKALHTDTTVSTEKTLASLKCLRDEIAVLIETVERDAMFEAGEP